MFIAFYAPSNNFFMKTKISLLLLLSFFVMGCHNKEAVNSIKTIDVDLKTSLCDNQSAFHDFNFVKLEFVEGSALRDIAKVVPCEDKLYILTLYDPNIFIFSSTGKYISSISKGQGPGEIISASDIEVYNKKLYVLDLYRTVKEYTLDGRFIRDEYKFEHPYFSMKHTENGIFLFDPNLDKKSDYYLHYFSDGNDNKCLMKNEYLTEVTFQSLNFIKNGCISWALCDTIYTIENNIPCAEYVVKFSDKNFFEQGFNDKMTVDELCEMTQDKTMIRWLKDVVPYKSGIYFSFNFDCTYFVRYENGVTKVYKKFVDGLPDIKQSSVGFSNNELVYVFTADDLLDYNTSNELKDNVKIQSLYQSIESEDDNPVLVFVKLE